MAKAAFRSRSKTQKASKTMHKTHTEPTPSQAVGWVDNVSNHQRLMTGRCPNVAMIILVITNPVEPPSSSTVAAEQHPAEKVIADIAHIGRNLVIRIGLVTSISITKVISTKPSVM
eukprot:Gregarina_sp_Poly_1__240@NODE_1056_length_5213_cov_138_229887_g734_i0_p5_GENE_NODE_1056_length_5213_cov_138_229887_g734_i0NODE_1056_length_5213_cov_138_229887_g734_i0_p5_ORF_typecomplete_len116_score6_22_NODE_1056_length_5213_cov_138_229887_g734_i042944641